jgi:hypothetical protein
MVVARGEAKRTSIQELKFTIRRPLPREMKLNGASPLESHGRGTAGRQKILKN